MLSEQEPTILFVDDEPGVLKALRRLFVDEEWNLLLASSGAEGLEILAEEPVDLIVSDVRMPEMDGIEFLTRAMRLYPSVVRIFLSGYAEKATVTEALAQGCAQQILPKPWNDDELHQVIVDALQQRRRQQQQSNTLQTLINSLPQLPSFPESYRIVSDHLAQDEDFDLELVQKYVERDIPLSAALLRMANSALFGQRGQVDSVARAIVLLGSEVVKNLFLSRAIDESLGSMARQRPDFDGDSFQRHSLACAIIGRLLAKYKFPEDAELADRVFIAGLLHDIGVLVVAGVFPDEFTACLSASFREKLLFAEAEQQVMQTTHLQLGAVLAEWWSLPGFIISANRWHLDPAMATEDQLLVELVALANQFSCQFGYCLDENCRIPELGDRLAEKYALTPEVVEMLQLELRESFYLD